MEKICPIMSTEYRDGKCVQCMREVCGLWDNVGECCGLCFRHGPTTAKRETKEEAVMIRNRQDRKKRRWQERIDMALAAFDEHETASISIIADFLEVSETTVHRWVKQMPDKYQINHGMVYRKRDSDD